MRAPQEIHKWIQISLRVRHIEKTAPHVQPRNRIIGFRLREKALRFRHFDDGR